MDLKEYREEVNRIFKHCMRYSFVDYRSCKRLYGEMTDLLEKAQTEFSGRGEYKELFELACRAFLKWDRTNKDDSDGETYDFCRQLTHIWDAVYASGDKRISHEKMMKWFTDQIEKDKVSNLEDELFGYLEKHFTEPALLEKKYVFYRKKIEDMGEIGDSSYSHEAFRKQYLRELVLKAMAELGKPIGEIREYAKTIESYKVNELMAPIELRYGNRERATELYLELADKADKSFAPRNNWHVSLMEIYKEDGKQEAYETELKKAVMTMPGDDNLWNEFKSLYSSEEWTGARAEFFSKVDLTDQRFYDRFAQEGCYDLIMAGIEEYPDAYAMKPYEKELRTLYPERCIRVLTLIVRDLAEYANTRNKYKGMAGLLARIKKCPGGEDAAAALAAEFRKAYPRRTAMLEEIRRF